MAIRPTVWVPRSPLQRHHARADRGGNSAILGGIVAAAEIPALAHRYGNVCLTRRSGIGPIATLRTPSDGVVRTPTETPHLPRFPTTRRPFAPFRSRPRR